MDTYHKHAKEWAANGAIMEDIITNFELVGHPAAAHLSDVRHAAGQALRDGGRAEDAGRAVPEVRLQFPGRPGDANQHVGLQGRDLIAGSYSPYRPTSSATRSRYSARRYRSKFSQVESEAGSSSLSTKSIPSRWSHSCW